MIREDSRYLVTFLILLLFFSGCTISSSKYSKVKLKKPPQHMTVVGEDKPILYIAIFEDMRTSKVICKQQMPFLYCWGFFGLLTEDIYTEDNVPLIVTGTFVDFMRKKNLNASALISNSKKIGKYTLLIDGKITDCMWISPWLFPIASQKTKIGIELELKDYEGRKLLTKNYLEEYKIPRLTKSPFPTLEREGFIDFGLRNLFGEILNDEEFKKAIAVLETSERTD